MDQPAIYSETVREGIGGGVGVSASRRRGDTAFWRLPTRGWLKTGASDLQRDTLARRVFRPTDFPTRVALERSREPPASNRQIC